MQDRHLFLPILLAKQIDPPSLLLQKKNLKGTVKRADNLSKGSCRYAVAQMGISNFFSQASAESNKMAPTDRQVTAAVLQSKDDRASYIVLSERYDDTVLDATRGGGYRVPTWLIQTVISRQRRACGPIGVCRHDLTPL